MDHSKLFVFIVIAIVVGVFEWLLWSPDFTVWLNDKQAQITLFIAFNAVVVWCIKKWFDFRWHKINIAKKIMNEIEWAEDVIKIVKTRTSGFFKYDTKILLSNSWNNNFNC